MRRWRIIYVKSSERAKEIEKLLSEFDDSRIATDIYGEVILDNNRYVVQCRATHTDFDPWIDKLGLMEVKCYNTRRHYILKEEI